MTNERLATPRPWHNGAPRFTLIEMLVVVAIFAILASMLAPALRKALDSAKDLNCLNNLHQIGVAAQTYADDAQGRFLPAPKDSPQWLWQDSLAPYCGVAPTASKDCSVEKHEVGSKVVWRHKGVLTCPTITVDWIVAKDNSDPNVDFLTSLTLDYGMNLHLNRIAMARVLRPGRTFAFMDICAPAGMYKTATAHMFRDGYIDCCRNNRPMYNYNPPRHRGQLFSNFAYSDGHAATHLMPVLDSRFHFIIGSGDIPDNCTQQDFKAGIWWHQSPH